MKTPTKPSAAKSGGRGPASLRDNRGIASIALFLFALVSVLILVANFQLNFAVNSTSDAYDTFSSQLVEKNGMSQMVKESILALRETAIADSANSLQTEIQNRLSSMIFPASVTVVIDPGVAVPPVPPNPFFPFAAPYAAAPPDYFTSTDDSRPIAGMGSLLSSVCMLGPVADLGRLTVSFDRSNTNSDGSADPNDDRTYVVNADLFSVPLTNVDVVAYGLPVTGHIPAAAPTLPSGFFGTDVSRLVVSSNNPSSDPTAYSDLFASTATERLPYQYRNAVSFSWNAYEYLWSPTYQDALIGNASSSSTIYNFEFPPAPPPLPAPQNQPFAGATINGNILTINCASITASVVAVVDPLGGGHVVITGSGGAGNPFILLVRNTTGLPTQVTFSGDNNRPGIFYLENSTVQFNGAPQIQGAIFLDPTTTIAAGTATLFGHLSFYGYVSPTLNITMVDSPAVKTALAPLAPRVLLVSTTATR